MIPRLLAQEIGRRLEHTPAVVLLGARQVGKTTLAKQLAKGRPSTHVDLETSPEREPLLANPHLYLDDHADELVILDEVQRVPELFAELRGVIDRGRQGGGRANGRFLLLGSASRELLAQSGESLAGRVAYMELTPLGVREVPDDKIDDLWVRGGFPESFLAPDEAVSATWRTSLITTYLERDVPQLGLHIPAEALLRLWTMLAHNQGCPLNAAQLARNLGVDGKTIVSYIDVLADLMLVRRLQPRLINVGKRLTRSPKVYVRDSGLTHALLGIADKEALVRHPVVGASWEAFALENAIWVAGDNVLPSFYRTATGVEIDLILEWPNETWAIEIKHSLTPRPTRGFYSALEDVEPDRAFVVYPGTRRYRVAPEVEALSLPDLCQEILAR